MSDSIGNLIKINSFYSKFFSHMCLLKTKCTHNKQWLCFSLFVISMDSHKNSVYYLPV